MPPLTMFALGRLGAGVGVEPVGVVADLLLEHDRPPRGAQSAWEHPGLDRHARGQVEARRIGDVDDVVDAVERQSGAELADRPGRAGNSAAVAAAGAVRDASCPLPSSKP